MSIPSVTSTPPARLFIGFTSLFIGLKLYSLSSDIPNRQNPETRQRNSLEFLRRFCRLYAICIPKGSKESLYVMGLTVLLLLRTSLSIVNVNLGALTATHFVLRRWNSLNRSLTKFLILSIPAALVNAALRYVQDALSISMRKNLSSHINNMYLRDTNFYKIKHFYGVKDPQNVITESVDEYSGEVANILSKLIKPVIDIVVYTDGLRRTVGWQGPVIIWIYFLLRHQISLMLKPVKHAINVQADYEKRHAAAHASLLSNADEIAFNNGVDTDSRVITELLDKATKQSWQNRTKSAVITAFDTLVSKYGASVAGYGVLLSPHLLGLRRVRHKTSTVMMREYIIILKTLTELNRGICELEDSFTLLASIEGSTRRVSELIDNLKEVTKHTEEVPASPHVGDGDFLAPEYASDWAKMWIKKRSEATPNQRSPTEKRHIEFRNVDIITPTGELLIAGVSFVVQPLQNLLITGRRGSGKTAILRALGGMWPVALSSIVTPPQERLYYLSESPHFVDGTLREQLIYPHSIEESRSLGFTDEHLAKLLCLTDHKQTILGTWSLNDRECWLECFSPHQKQCINITRMYYHLPAYALLDGSTSWLSKELETFVYATCRALGITCISTSMDPLYLYHQHTFALNIEAKRARLVKNKLER